MTRKRIEPSFEPKPRIVRRAPPPPGPPPEPPDDDPPEAFDAEPPKRRRTWPYVLSLLLAWGMIFGAIVFTRWISELPDISGLMARAPSHDITILDDKGRFVARRGLSHGALVDVSGLPSYVPNAFIAIEDRRFREHFGIDFKGLVRAALANAEAGHVVQGGSTITQQLAKNLFLKPKRTFSRKLQEALLALYLEARYSKDQILTLYLNRVYFGAGVYGIEGASEKFFDKPAARLTLSEAAMLAGSVKAPSQYNPLADSDASARRARTVLKAMNEEGFLTRAQYQDAISTRPRIATSSGTPGSGYFVDWVIANLSDEIGEVNEPLVVKTTLDLEMQADAEHVVQASLATEGSDTRASQAALVAMTPGGAVRAMVGGRSYSESPFNRATDALRQPGSSFKPFVYLTALEHGHTANETIDDKPIAIGKWRPGNYDNRYEGRITLARAFAESSNSAAAQLTANVGAKAVAATAHRLGITAPLDPVPALALGVSTVSPLEMTQGYAAFANGGTAVQAFGIASVRTASGKPLYVRKGSGLGRVMSPDDAQAMTGLMMDVTRYGTGKAARLADRDTAGKTGTTQDFRDAWFIGFTADYVCGVWAGNDDNSPMKHVTGGKLPAHIFHAFMTDAEKDLPPRSLVAPASVAAVQPAPLPVAPAAATAPPNRDAFEQILDKLFGGT